jgi:hemolysin III
MNSRQLNPNVRPTAGELRADAAVHVVGLLGGAVGAVSLILHAAGAGVAKIATAAIYSAGLLSMFGCSAAHNHTRHSRRRPLLHALDHSAIFVMIAASYTPFTALRLEGAWSYGFTLLVWLVAGLGIILRVLRPILFDRLSLGLYLSLGWVGLCALPPLSRALDPLTLVLLALGGLIYTAGVTFHIWERMSFHKAVWHTFVLAGAGVHYAAITRVIAIS